jgi:hypothetical protein
MRERGKDSLVFIRLSGGRGEAKRSREKGAEKARRPVFWWARPLSHQSRRGDKIGAADGTIALGRVYLNVVIVVS